jgi:protein TonB
MRINYFSLDDFSMNLLKHGLLILSLHALIALLIIYGLPDINFKKIPDLTIEFSNLNGSLGNDQGVSSNSIYPKPIESKNVIRSPDGLVANKKTFTDTPKSAIPVGISATSEALDYKSNYLNNPKPPYPALAIKLGLEGKVVILVDVLPSGKAGKVVVENSSGHELLDQSALQTISKWQFASTRKDGVITNQVIRIPITFNLKSR